MQVMAQYPDKYFDLAVVDPPYGINFAKTHTGEGWVVREAKEWDKQSPTREYFQELRRVSENQIIWGGNYMVDNIGPSMGWIFWDKGQRNFSLADGELAYTSFNRALRVFEYSRAKLNKERGGYHPTEKPVALYDWIFKNYAEAGMKILDTHGGSMSSVISADKAGLDMVCCEKDQDYFEKAVERFRAYKSQSTLQFNDSQTIRTEDRPATLFDEE